MMEEKEIEKIFEIINKNYFESKLKLNENVNIRWSKRMTV
jgi:hypothetical protein